MRSKDIYGKNKVIFTSRPLGYEKNKSPFESRYEYLRICPFDSERIRAYMHGNYIEPQFQRVLKENKELLAIPQLLKMTRTLLESRSEEFARIKTRSDLYERFIHHLIREESGRYGTQDVFAHAEEIKRIIDHLEYLYWDEVWLFLVGGLEYKQAREIINYLEKCDHYLAALCLRAYKGNRKDFKSLIDGLFKEIHNSKARDVLVKITDTEIETTWIGLLKDEDLRVRGYAFVVLGEIKSEKAAEPLIGLLKDEDSVVRESAAVALGNISPMLNSSDQDKLILQLSTLSREKDIPRYYGYIDAIEQIKKATGRRFPRIINSHPQ